MTGRPSGQSSGPIEHLLSASEESGLERGKTAAASALFHSRFVEFVRRVAVVRFQDLGHPMPALVPAGLVPQIVHHPALTESEERTIRSMEKQKNRGRPDAGRPREPLLAGSREPALIHQQSDSTRGTRLNENARDQSLLSQRRIAGSLKGCYARAQSTLADPRPTISRCTTTQNFSMYRCCAKELIVRQVVIRRALERRRLAHSRMLIQPARNVLDCVAVKNPVEVAGDIADVRRAQDVIK